MAHVKVDVVVSIDKIESIGLENAEFEFHADSEYSSKEVIAVMGALSQYMADLIKVVEQSKP